MIAARPAATETAVAQPDFHPGRAVLGGSILALVFSSFAILAVVAINPVLISYDALLPERHPHMPQQRQAFGVGLRAVVVIEIFMPLTFSTLL